jgi:hypothetical protein
MCILALFIAFGCGMVVGKLLADVPQPKFVVLKDESTLLGVYKSFDDARSRHGIRGVIVEIPPN